jgi:hypothetical protein
VCFGKPDFFATAFEEVGGFGWENVGTLAQPQLRLPRYIPTIQHGYRRTKCLRTPWAALPLSVVLARSKTGARPRARSPHELREQFALAPTTRLLLLGIDDDPKIEHYWRWQTDCSLATALGALEWHAAVVPNYSILLDHPRTHHLYNRKRSLLVAREWSQAHIPAMPYLQAVSLADYDYWLAFLTAHPEVALVAKEFQTGLARRTRGLIALDQLAKLQDRLRRSLHVVAVGGAQYRSDLAQRFDFWTVVDSTPFIKAVKRRQGSLGDKRVVWRAARDRSVEVLLPHNIGVYRTWLAGAAPEPRALRRSKPHVNTGQLTLPLPAQPGQGIPAP